MYAVYLLVINLNSGVVLTHDVPSQYSAKSDCYHQLAAVRASYPEGSIKKGACVRIKKRA